MTFAGFRLKVSLNTFGTSLRINECVLGFCCCCSCCCCRCCCPVCSWCFCALSKGSLGQTWRPACDRALVELFWAFSGPPAHLPKAQRGIEQNWRCNNHANCTQANSQFNPSLIHGYVCCKPSLDAPCSQHNPNQIHEGPYIALPRTNPYFSLR